MARTVGSCSTQGESTSAIDVPCASLSLCSVNLWSRVCRQAVPGTASTAGRCITQGKVAFTMKTPPCQTQHPLFICN